MAGSEIQTNRKTDFEDESVMLTNLEVRRGFKSIKTSIHINQASQVSGTQPKVCSVKFRWTKMDTSNYKYDIEIIIKIYSI